MIRPIVMLSVVAIAFTGCSVVGNPFGHVDLTPEGAKVKMRSSAADVAKCKSLGDVEGADDVQIASDIREDNAIKALKNATAAKGGDTVLVISTSNKGSRQHGEAYRCGDQ